MTKFSGMRVLVTGGAGFIGSHLVDQLLDQGAHVIVFDDFSSCGRANIQHLEGHDRLTVMEADVRDISAVNTAVKNIQTVFHMATRNVRLSLHRPTEVHEVNVSGTYNLLKASAAAGVMRFLYCSSSEVNGTAKVLPLPEDYAFEPETIYGASKLAGEYYAQVFHRSGWLETVIARPHNTYGPREHYLGHNGEVIPRFILFALAGKAPTVFGDGQQTRDFTYVTETAEFLARLAVHKDTAGGVYNLCRGKEVAILEIATQIAQLTGLNKPPVHLPERPHDVLRLWGDPRRLKQVLGAAPTINIDDGLKRTVDWFRQNVELTDRVLSSMAPANWANVEREPWMD
jgi:UDP-glucose 4-epimerase